LNSCVMPLRLRLKHWESHRPNSHV
jgi:hypothetical protein